MIHYTDHHLLIFFRAYSMVDSSRVSTYIISILLIVYGSFRSLNIEQETRDREKEKEKSYTGSTTGPPPPTESDNGTYTQFVSFSSPTRAVQPVLPHQQKATMVRTLSLSHSLVLHGQYNRSSPANRKRQWYVHSVCLIL